MAIGSGLAAQLGMIQEVTPGTALSPTHFYEFTSETFNLQQLLGSFNAGATPVMLGSSTAYLQTHIPGSNWGKSFTLQKGAPDSSGTVHALNYPGCKVTDW